MGTVTPSDMINRIAAHVKDFGVGMHLVRMEMEVVLESLVAYVERIDVGEPELAWNNVLQGFSVLPARLHKAVDRRPTAIGEKRV